MNRRRFLKQSGWAAAGFVILGNSASARGAAANERLNLAHVGVSGRGRALLMDFARRENTVALCDVNQSRAAPLFERFPQAAKFVDFREMLDQLGVGIDAVVVATPDHTHAVVSAAALRAGKHVYCEKPLSRTVHESRVLRELAQQGQLATSMGNQGTGSGPFRRALELIRGGRLGEIREVHMWNDQGGAGWEQPPEGQEAVPAGLDWDRWLGPARQRLFHPRWLTWHGWRDFGTGNLGNWSSHTTNLPFMALRVDALWSGTATPGGRIRVQAEVDALNGLSFPRWELVRWEIPARGDLPPIIFHWHNGSRRPGVRDQLESLLGRGLDWGDKGERKWADWAGCLIVGSEGMIYSNAHNSSFTLLPDDRFRDVQTARPEHVDPSHGHDADWLLACRGGPAPWARFDYAGPLTEFNMLGNVATQFAEALEYDPLAGRIVNHPQANALLASDYRSGWRL